MANIIGIMGESGAGKTTSMRNLDPKTTYYIDCDKKGLSWRGWKKQYNAENKNYFSTDKQNDVLKIMQGINTDRPHIKTIVIDTLNGIMVADEMRRSKEKGYDKWMDLAVSVYGIIDYALTMRDDLTVVFVCLLFFNKFKWAKTAHIFTWILANFAIQSAGLIVSPEIVALVATNIRASSFVNRKEHINRCLSVNIGCNAAFKIRHFRIPR